MAADDIRSRMMSTMGSSTIDPNEKLFLFGYSCKIFRDDEKALYIDQGKHLIPWMGDKSHMIDRYDVRGYLHDLKQYEPIAGDYEDLLSEEEQLCDEERYRSLRSEACDEQLYHEEELKRLRAAVAADGAYHEIAFTYDNADNGDSVDADIPKDDEPEDEVYEIPEGLEVPKGMEVPSTMKIHAIIEKTALFVSQQGGQMEIIIKMKQQANPQFAFMHLDNPLYPYYKHLVTQIKVGTYRPMPVVKKVSQSEDEDEDGHYLHPSLLGGRQNVPKFTVPTLNFKRSQDDSYSVLVRKLQKHREEEKMAQGTAEDSKAAAACVDYESSFSENESTQTVFHVPPPEQQPVIDKMAEYVGKNGVDFETIVKAKNDPRFAFLEDSHIYHMYYLFKRDAVTTENATEAPNDNGYNNNSAQQCAPLAPVVRESGPVLYPSAFPTVEQPAAPQQPPERKAKRKKRRVTEAAQEEGPVHGPMPAPVEETTDSLDCLGDSQSSSDKDEESAKPNKTTKGPISFSLKVKDTESQEREKLVPLLLYDSEEEESPEGGAEERGEGKKEEKPEVVPEVEVKATPKPSTEELEAKYAEERIKSKLMATARERLAQQRKEKQLLLEQQRQEEQLKKEKQELLEQQRKEKQLQLDRKRKAAIFLKMLQKKNPDSTAIVSHVLESDKNSSGVPVTTDFWSAVDTSGPAAAPTVGGILFSRNNALVATEPAESSSDSAPEHSGEEEPISVFGEKLSEPEELLEATSANALKKKRKKKKRSHSRERSRPKKSKSKHKTRSRSRSRSLPRSYKQERPRKELPAAYALHPRSRSRSRSPRRHRPSFSHWNKRR